MLYVCYNTIGIDSTNSCPNYVNLGIFLRPIVYLFQETRAINIIVRSQDDIIPLSLLDAFVPIVNKISSTYICFIFIKQDTFIIVLVYYR